QAVFVAVAGHRLTAVDRDRALPIAEEILASVAIP
ncbi:MAG: hypothetical protein JWR16_1754, partial [Nevskia sp.]|nr:hypothetical protein [Nevskia sp.]